MGRINLDRYVGPRFLTAGDLFTGGAGQRVGVSAAGSSAVNWSLTARTASQSVPRHARGSGLVLVDLRRWTASTAPGVLVLDLGYGPIQHPK